MTIREMTDFDKKEILGLYAAVGWTAYTEEADPLLKGLENSLLVLAAYEDGRLAGLVRVVGDACTIVFVQDILVHPAFRRRGIGSALLKEILGRYAHVRQIVLVTDNTPETNAFYRSLGFVGLSEINCGGFMRIRRG